MFSIHDEELGQLSLDSCLGTAAGWPWKDPASSVCDLVCLFGSLSSDVFFQTGQKWLEYFLFCWCWALRYFLVWCKAECDTDRVGQEERKVRNEPEKRGEGCILHIPDSEVEGSQQFYVSIATHKDDVVNPEGKRIHPIGIHQLFFLQESPWEGLETMILGATTPPLIFLLTWTNLSVYSTFDTIPQTSSASVWDETYQNFCELEHWPGGWMG